MLKGVIKVCRRGARQQMYSDSLIHTKDVLKSLKSALVDPMKYAEEEASQKVKKEAAKKAAPLSKQGPSVWKSVRRIGSYRTSVR